VYVHKTLLVAGSADGKSKTVYADLSAWPVDASAMLLLCLATEKPDRGKYWRKDESSER